MKPTADLQADSALPGLAAICAQGVARAVRPCRLRQVRSPVFREQERIEGRIRMRTPAPRAHWEARSGTFKDEMQDREGDDRMTERFRKSRTGQGGSGRPPSSRYAVGR